MRLMGGRTRRHARRGIAGGSCVNRACLSVCLSLRGSALRLVSFSWVPCLGARPPLAGRDLGGCFLFVLAGSFVHFFGPSGCPHRRPRCFRSAAFFVRSFFLLNLLYPFSFGRCLGLTGSLCGSAVGHDMAPHTLTKRGEKPIGSGSARGKKAPIAARRRHHHSRRSLDREDGPGRGPGSTRRRKERRTRERNSESPCAHTHASRASPCCCCHPPPPPIQ